MRQHRFGGSSPFLGTTRSRWIAVALSLVALLGAIPSAVAAGRAALVIDANTGQDLHAKDADRPLFPASLTKMMTLYLTFERIEQKRISYASRFQISEACAGKPPSNLDLAAGASLTVREAVLALIVKSANDVACVVGENLGGSEDKFAGLMTSRARQLGMRATTFRNASGLPDPGQVTTARDMATLALRLSHDFPEHYKLFSTREFTFNGHTHRSHNSLLHGFEGTDGIKTGYTRSSGFNLVSSVRRGQKHVIGVVFGGVTAAQRNSHMRAILTQGFGRAKAMASPLLVRRPALVAEPLRAADKPPVPRRVAQAPGESTANDASPIAAPAANTLAPLARTSPPRQPVVVASAGNLTPAPATPPRAVLERVAATPPGNTPSLGRPPATLQEQAAGRAPAATAGPVQTQPRPPIVGAASTIARPAGLGASAASGPFQVQIGAFSSQTEAQRQLSAVSGRAGALLAGHAPLTVPFAKANLQFYRARFAGFDEGKAQAACQSLKQQKIECVVMRAE
jgi:D-alanyl-D-alanine carboxypeptidase